MADLPPNLIVDTVPTPDSVRRELLGLYRRVRLTRSLLRLAEKVHAVSTTPQTGGADPKGGAPCRCP